VNEVEIRITAHDLTGPAFAGAMAKMAALRKEAKSLSDDLGGIALPRLDTNLLESSLMNLRSKIQSLGIADIADVNVQPGRIMTQMQLLKRLISQAGISDVLDFNVKDGSLASQLAKIHGLTETIPVNFAVKDQIPTSMPAQDIIDKFSIQGLDIAAQQLAESKAQTDLFSQALTHLQSEKDSLIEDINLGLIPALNHTDTSTSTVTRTFGGWLGILGASVGGIGLWHVALDGALESTIALGTATAALTVGIATMVPTAQDIYTHLQAVSTVNAALGSQIPPLTGKFDALAQAMAPQTIEAYGGALNLVSSNSGNLARISSEVVTGLDDWIAKIDLWSHSQSNMGGLLQTGVNFLHQFEGIVNDVGVAISNLVRADPGTAHFLLDIVGGAGQVLDVITRLPSPLLETALALHSMYLWGNVLGGLLEKLPGRLGSVGTAINAIGHNPGLLVIAATAYEMERAWDSASPAVQNDIKAISASLQAMPASDAIVSISADIGKLNAAMAGVSTQGITAGWTGFTGIFQETDDKIQAIGHDLATAFSPGSMNLHGLDALGNAFKDVFDQGAAESQAATVQIQHDIGALNSEIQSLIGQQGNLFSETGALMKQGYSYSQALALMDLAGVKSTDTLALMQQKVANLVTGYQNLSVAGASLMNAVDAVTFAALQQQSKVQTLNQGWDAFLATITGGASGFVTFGQALATVDTDAKATGASMLGLNANSLTLQGGFLQAASAANSQMDSLTTLTSAAGLGAKGTTLLTQANKDLVAAMLPAAANSSTMTTVLYALAQRGGYTGADSFKQLTQWVGNVQNPMLNLQGIVGTLTRAAGNLTTDVQNLSTALGTTLNAAMATAILDANGGQKTFDNFATSILKTGVNSDSTRASALKLADGLYSLTGNVNDARSEFETFAEKGLGLTAAQADTLWKQTLPSLQKTIDSLHGKSVGVNVVGSGSGTITFAEQDIKNAQTGYLEFHAAGGPVLGAGGPRQDNIPIMASSGEYVMQASAVDKYGAGFMGAVNAGRYASGGLIDIDQFQNAASWASGAQTAAAKVMEQMAAQSMVADMNSKIAAMAASVPSVITAGSSGGVIATMMKNMAAAIGWTGTLWDDLYAVEMREAGFNMTATNPSSDAYGLAQFINGPSEYYAYGGNPTTAIGQVTGMLNYIKERYGSPAGAWSHEVNYGWYDTGGILPPGLTMAYNGTGQNEYVSRGGGGDIHITLELGSSFKNAGLTDQQLEDIRYTVRAKGGRGPDAVQRAFSQS